MDSSPPPDVAGVRDTTYAALGAWRQRAARVGHQPLIREHGWTLAFVCVAAVAFVVLFMAGRHGTFYGDEWYFIGIRGFGTFDDWMRPWGVHWSFVPLIVYRAIFSVIQLHSYLPYLAVLLTVHVAGGAALYILIRRASGPFVALCAATVFLLLGSAWLNLLWAFQLGFVISTATGLWAIVAFERGDRRGDATGAVLVMLSLASSGMGIAFAVAVGVELLARRPRAVAWLVPVGLAFAAWFLVWDRTATAATSTGTTDPNTIVAFVAFGPLSYIDALTGFGPSAGVGLYAVALLVGAATVLRHVIAPRAVGATAGLAMMLALIAVGRGAFGISTTQHPRYVYEGVVFVLLAVSALLGRRAATVPKSPTGGVVLASIVTLTLVAVVRNVGMLDGGAAYLVQAAGDLRAVVALTERYGPEQLNAPPPAMKTWYIPAPKDLVRIMARYGRLDDDVFRPTVVVPTTPAQRDRALWRVLGGTVLPSPTSPPTGAPPVNGGGQPPPRILMATGPLTLDGGCLLLEGPSVTVEGSVTVIGPGAWTIGLGRESNPQPVDFLTATIAAGWYRILVPDLGDGATYKLALHPPPGARICSL